VGKHLGKFVIQELLLRKRILLCKQKARCSTDCLFIFDWKNVLNEGRSAHCGLIRVLAPLRFIRRKLHSQVFDFFQHYFSWFFNSGDQEKQIVSEVLF